MSPYVRTVKTASGARAVQIVHSSRRGSRDIEHIGSAHDDAELELLKAVARQRLVGGQDELDLGLQSAEPTGRGPLPITSSRMGQLWDALSHAYEVVGFERAAGGDEVFRQLVLAQIIEPTSKLDSLRVLEEVAIDPAIYRTLTRRLPVFAKDSWRQKIATACAAQTTLRKVVGQHTLDETLSETNRINTDIREILDVTTVAWGVEVTLVELKDIQLPDSMKRAMARQAEAEREKRAKIINAEGESLAAAALGDASDTMMAHPLALQLRNLQSLVEIEIGRAHV